MARWVLAASLILLAVLSPRPVAVAAGGGPWLVEVQLSELTRAESSLSGVRLVYFEGDLALLAVDGPPEAILGKLGVAGRLLTRVPSGSAAYLLRLEGERTAVNRPRPSAWLSNDDALFVCGSPPDPTLLAEGSLLRLPLGGLPWPDPAAEPAALRPVDYDPKIQALVDRVEAGRLRELVETLAGFDTRFTYTNGCRQAADWAADFFRDQGLFVELQTHDPAQAPNVIARKEGLTAPERIWILCAHLDSVSLQARTLAPGADDNGSGSALVLHLAELLREQTFDETILFCLWTGEEMGLLGSAFFAAKAALEGMEIAGVLNFDMIGWSEPYPEDLDVVVNNASRNLGEAFQGTTELYTTHPVVFRVLEGARYSDHASFWLQGYPAFLGIEDTPLNYPYYHKITDTPDKLDYGLVSDCARAAVAGLATFAGLLEGPPEEGIEVRLTMNSHSYGPRDELWLWYEVTRRGPALDADLYVVLEALGHYYFYPAWSEVPEARAIAVPADGSLAEEILRLQLPGTLPQGGPFAFHSVLTAPGESEPLCGIDSWSFEFR